MASTLEQLMTRFNEKHADALVLTDRIMQAANDFDEKWEAEEIRREIFELHSEREQLDKFSLSRESYDVEIAKLTREKKKLEETLKDKIHALPESKKLDKVILEALNLKEELKGRFYVHVDMCIKWPC